MSDLLPATDGLFLGEETTPRRWDGRRLINLDASKITLGTLAAARYPEALLRDGSRTITDDITIEYDKALKFPWSNPSYGVQLRNDGTYTLAVRSLDGAVAAHIRASICYVNIIKANGTAVFVDTNDWYASTIDFRGYDGAAMYSIARMRSYYGDFYILETLNVLDGVLRLPNTRPTSPQANDCRYDPATDALEIYNETWKEFPRLYGNGIHIYNRLFSIDGLDFWADGAGSCIFIGSGWHLKTDGTLNNEANISDHRDKSLQTPSWDKKRKFRAAVRLVEESGEMQYVVSGYGDTASQTQQHFGFKIIDNKIYGCAADGSNETTLELQTFEAMNCVLEAVFTPNVDVKFYVDGVLKGTITTNLPSGTTGAEYLTDFHTKITDAVIGEAVITIYEYEFYQYP